jgi:hypothetical protein
LLRTCNKSIEGSFGAKSSNVKPLFISSTIDVNHGEPQTKYSLPLTQTALESVIDDILCNNNMLLQCATISERKKSSCGLVILNTFVNNALLKS